MLESQDSPGSQERLRWLDDLRAIAIAVMVVDHALLFFFPDDSSAGLIRCTLTRCAEPLFVFVLTSVAMHKGRRVRRSRWIQIVMVSWATSAVISLRLGYVVADVLASIALAAPLLPAILTFPKRLCLVAVYVAAVLAVTPAALCGVAFDYSPALVIYQMLLTRLVHGKGAATHAVASGGVAVGTALALMEFGLPLPPAILVILMGHPLAAGMILLIRAGSSRRGRSTPGWAAHPLKIYAIHLAAFALSSQLISRQ